MAERRQAVEDYERWAADKRKRQGIGVGLCVLAMLVGFGAGVALPNDPDARLVVSVMASLVSVCGGSMIATARGASPAAGLVGILALLVPDRNVREVPGPVTVGEKPAGSAFSNW